MEEKPVTLSPENRRLLLAFQENEITEHHIYARLAQAVGSPENRQVLERIAADELRHYQYWGEHTGVEVRPNRLKMWLYYLIGRTLGLTFAVKLMERGERDAHEGYARVAEVLPGADRIAREEDEHEQALIGLLDEERLHYTGSIVLGLNDALVELTGALAGLTFALQDTRLIAMTGAVTGIAAALSMAASEYLSTRAEETDQDPIKAALYTGAAYIFAVLVLIFPYLVLTNYIACLAATLVAGILIIAFFNYYVSVAQDVPFRRRFLEMAAISLGVAAISFGIGALLRSVFGVEV